MGAIVIQGVGKRLGSVHALKSIRFTLKGGEIVGFLGHNGAGKTTLMRIMLGLLRQDGGAVEVDGFDTLRDPPETRVRTGGLIEHPGFQPGWTGRRNIEVMARLQGLSRTAARSEAERLLGLLNLNHAKNRPLRTWSQGMRQRLGLALALLGTPKYLILDEPMNGLDPEGIAEFREILRRLRDEVRVGILISSHQLQELAPLCDRIVIIQHGELILEGSLNELLGERTVLLVRATPPDAAARALAPMGFVETPRGLERPAAGVRPADAARALGAAGAEIETLQTIPPSLEDIYLSAGLQAGPSSPPARPAEKGPPQQEARQAPGRPILRALRYDLSRLNKAAVLLAALVPAALGGLAIAQRESAHREALDAMGGGTLATTTVVTAFEMLGVGLRGGLPILAFLVLGLATQSVSAEAGLGTLRNVLMRPLRRWHLAAAKTAGVLLVTLFAYLLLVAAMGLAAVATRDFESVYEILPNQTRYEFLSARDLWSLVPRLLWEPILPLVALAMLGLWIGTVVRRSATALGLGLVAMILLDGARGPARLSDAEAWLPSAHLPSLLGDRTSYVFYYFDRVQGIGNALWPLEGTGPLPMLAWAGVLALLTATSLIRRPVP